MPNGLGRTPEARKRRIVQILKEAKKREGQIKGEEFKRELVRKQRERELMKARERERKAEQLQRKLKVEKEKLALLQKKAQVKKIKSQRLKMKFAPIVSLTKEVSRELGKRGKTRRTTRKPKEVSFGFKGFDPLFTTPKKRKRRKKRTFKRRQRRTKGVTIVIKR